MNPSINAHKIILLLLFMSFAVQLTLSSVTMEVVLLGGQGICLLIPLLIYLVSTGGRISERLGLKPCKITDILRGIGVVLLLQPFLMLAATIAENIAGNPMEDLLENLASEPVWLTVLGLAILPALIEELVFRGFLLGSYRSFSIGSAALLNGLVFGMFHMNVYQFSYAMVLGMFFSVVTRRAGSVFPAMIMHFLNNLISVMLLYRMDSNWYQTLEAMLTAGTSPGPGLLGGVLAGALSLGMALWVVLPKGSTDSFPSQEPVEEVKLQYELYRDWPLLFFVLIFIVLAVVPPVMNLFAVLLSG